MTEVEVLKKLDYFKQAIISLKEERDYWQAKAEENPAELISDNSEEIIQENEKLKEEITQLKKEKETLEIVEKNLKTKCEELSSTEKQYTEEDLKKLLSKANEKSKQKILELQTANKIFEETCDHLREEISGLSLTNKNLERKLKEATAEKEIEKVLHGEITESEIDNVLESSIDKPVKIVKVNV